MNRRPRFTKYSLETITSNSVISSAKAQDELGYHSRPIQETLSDTVRWLVEYARLFELSKAGV